MSDSTASLKFTDGTMRAIPVGSYFMATSGHQRLMYRLVESGLILGVVSGSAYIPDSFPGEVVCVYVEEEMPISSTWPVFDEWTCVLLQDNATANKSLVVVSTPPHLRDNGEFAAKFISLGTENKYKMSDYTILNVIGPVDYFNNTDEED